jgi:hypothetical protein
MANARLADLWILVSRFVSLSIISKDDRLVKRESRVVGSQHSLDASFSCIWTSHRPRYAALSSAALQRTYYTLCRASDASIRWPILRLCREHVIKSRFFIDHCSAISVSLSTSGRGNSVAVVDNTKKSIAAKSGKLSLSVLSTPSHGCSCQLSHSPGTRTEQN